MMRTGTMREQGSIILIPVPFTDLSSTKRRPVIVISNNEYNQTTSDMVVVAMTSNPSQTPYSFTISNEDLVEGQLNRPGKVRVDKIYTLSQSLAVRTFGKVSLTTMKRIRSLLGDVTKIRNTAEVTLSSCHAERREASRSALSSPGRFASLSVTGLLLLYCENTHVNPPLADCHRCIAVAAHPSPPSPLSQNGSNTAKVTLSHRAPGP